MSCLTAPATLEAWLGVITCAARAYGGEQWPWLALLGAAGVALALLAVLLVVVAARSSMRP